MQKRDKVWDSQWASIVARANLLRYEKCRIRVVAVQSMSGKKLYKCMWWRFPYQVSSTGRCVLLGPARSGNGRNDDVHWTKEIRQRIIPHCLLSTSSQPLGLCTPSIWRSVTTIPAPPISGTTKCSGFIALNILSSTVSKGVSWSWLFLCYWPPKSNVIPWVKGQLE